MSTLSQMERANSRALTPVPLADEPNDDDVPSMRYTGLVIGTSYITRVQQPGEIT